MNKSKYDTLAAELTKTGYGGLFLHGEHSLADSFWLKGENKDALTEIVTKNQYDDYARLLASEILFQNQKDYPPKDLENTLAYIYTKALFITGDNSEIFRLPGNLWGLLYYTDKSGTNDYGGLGAHLIKTGKKAIPYLNKLLYDTNTIYYEGSEEATIGNSLKYRVKDAAAYYIGKITGISVQFYKNDIDRDAEIERLKEKIK